MSSTKPALLPNERLCEWVQHQAACITNEKGVASQDTQPVSDAVRDAYTRIYRGVAFDVDGTLTPPGKVDVDPEMARIIANLLRRGVPILLITGRGRKSTRAAVDQITEIANLHPSYLRRLRCITHNGLFYLSTPNQFPPMPLSQERLIAEPLACIAAVRSEILALCSSKSVQCDITDEPTALQAAGLRITFRHSDIDFDELQTDIRSLIGHVCQTPEDHFVTRGTYGNSVSFDISATNKGLAISHFAQEIGVHVDQVLCIGDQGAEGGNDYDLLKRVTGFSVNTVSQDPTVCFPIYPDSLGAKLTGAEATRALLQRVMLFPAISIAPVPADQRLRALRDFERIALQRAREEDGYTLDRVRGRLRYILDPHSRDTEARLATLTDLFDRLSGGVRIRDYEISELRDRALLGELFHFDEMFQELTEPPETNWAMFTDTGVLLRGPNYYYGWVYPNKCVADLLDVAIPFISTSRRVVRRYSETRLNFASYKILLAVLDNVRNLLLLVLYSAYTAEGQKGENYRFTATLYQLLIEHSSLFIDFLTDVNLTLSYFGARIDRLYDKLSQLFQCLMTQKTEHAVSIRNEHPRHWRECDSFVQNYAAVHLGLQEFREQFRGDNLSSSVVVGLGYGGLELPAIASAIASKQGWKLCAAVLPVSIYHEREIGEVIRKGRYEELREQLQRHRAVFSDCGLSWGSDWTARPVFLADDNCTTGVTLQLARDILASRGADILGAIVVRFPGANRHVQMAIQGHGFPDPEMLFSFIRGLVASSPYSRLLFPSAGENMYLDNLGIFCKARDRIQKYLAKNGTPPPPPRVDAGGGKADSSPSDGGA